MVTEVEGIIDQIIELSRHEITKPKEKGRLFKTYLCPKCGCGLLKKEFGSIWDNGGRWSYLSCAGCGYAYGYRDLGGLGRDIKPKTPSMERIRVTDFNREKKL